MVLHSKSGSETLYARQTMASTVPAKSQPLHNFSLPHLKWKKNHTNNHHRGRRVAESSSHQSPPSDSAAARQSPLFDSAPRQSPMRDSEVESDSGFAKNGFGGENRSYLAAEGVRTGFSVPSKNDTNNHHSGRRLADSSPHRSPPTDALPRQSPFFGSAHRLSPMRDSAYESDCGYAVPLKNGSVAENRRNPAPDGVRTGYRGRRLPDSSPHQSPLRQSPVPRQSPMRDSASESDSGHAVSLKNGSVAENRKKSAPHGVKTGFSSPSSGRLVEKSDKKSTASDVDVSGGKERRSKLYIRLPKNNKPEGPEHTDPQDEGRDLRPRKIKREHTDAQDEGKDLRLRKNPDDVQDEGKKCTGEGEGEVEVEESGPKWNFRPRKPLYGGTSKVAGSLQENKAQLPQAAPETVVNASEKKEKKQKFSIALGRDEIEDDLYAMTGSKPSRRPKKRAKAVQKQLDCVFPGLWLASITLDSYKVSEALAKA